MSPDDLLSPAALRVLERASAESAQLGAPAISTAHLLLGIVGNGNDAAALVLRGLGIDHARTSGAIGQRRERGSHEFGNARLSGYARKALDAAAREAKALNSSEIAPIHILLALFGVPKSVAAVALGGMELTPRSLEARLRGMYIPGSTPASLATAFERIAAELSEVRVGENAFPSGTLRSWDLGLRVQVALLNAQGLTWRMGHSTIGTHHLLYTALDDRLTATHRVLSGTGVRAPEFRLIVKAVERRATPGSGPFLSGGAQAVILGGVREARALRSPSPDKEHLLYCGRRLGRSEVDIDHLIMAMTRIDQCVGSLMLRSLGLNLDDVRRKLELALSQAVQVHVSAAEPPGSFWEGFNQQALRTNMSLSELATGSGISVKLLRQWVSGRRRPSAKSCDTIAAAFQIDRNIVRQWVGRPRVPDAVRQFAGTGEDRRTQLGEVREMFEAVEWSRERLDRMGALLWRMIANDRER